MDQKLQPWNSTKNYPFLVGYTKEFKNNGFIELYKPQHQCQLKILSAMLSKIQEKENPLVNISAND